MSSTSRARSFAVACLAAILWLTLTPALREAGHPVPSPWCFRCGEGDSADILLNIVLFVPLGTALAWLGLGKTPALTLATALTISIELTQFFFVPGRDGSIRDVLCNAMGGAIGFGLAPHWRGMLLPSIGWARRSFAFALAFWFGLALLSSWALGGTAPPGEWWIQLDPHGLGSADFPGHLVSAELNATGLANGRLEAPAFAKAAIAERKVDNTIRLVPGGPVVGTAPIFGIVTDEPIEVLRLSQRGDDGLYRFDVRGYSLGLVVPVFALPRAFAAASPDTIRWRTEYDGRRLRLEAVHSTGERQHSEVSVTPNQGWQLFWPFEPRLPAQATIITMLWALALPLIAGYYSAFQSHPTTISVAWIAGILLVTAVLLPLLAGIALATPLELLASVAGAAMGWSAGTIFRERL